MSTIADNAALDVYRSFVDHNQRESSYIILLQSTGSVYPLSSPPDITFIPLLPHQALYTLLVPSRSCPIIRCLSFSFGPPSESSRITAHQGCIIMARTINQPPRISLSRPSYTDCFSKFMASKQYPTDEESGRRYVVLASNPVWRTGPEGGRGCTRQSVAISQGST